MILLTQMWEDTPNFPKPPQRKEFLHKLLVKLPGYLPEICGWDLREFHKISMLGLGLQEECSSSSTAYLVLDGCDSTASGVTGGNSAKILIRMV